ncbi:MAG: ATP-binding cassette domain-containing protein, partial [Actinomycetota bacterium]
LTVARPRSRRTARLSPAVDADALSFVDELSDGAETVVGERGVSLSGGQRQRVALARAWYRHASVLLIDDTTSALDPTTEQTIVRRLQAIDGLSCVIVASRPSTVAVADRVVYIEHGSIRAQGTHEELLASSHEYRSLIESYESDRRAREGS